ncbi:hypothetical protein HDU67_009232 [Dinochytrium kinnereticum]|nr:hypothetical protein HDU67_009232 [Dinochytrium kinnereticum]
MNKVIGESKISEMPWKKMARGEFRVEFGCKDLPARPSQEISNAIPNRNPTDAQLTLLENHFNHIKARLRLNDTVDESGEDEGEGIGESQDMDRDHVSTDEEQETVGAEEVYVEEDHDWGGTVERSEVGNAGDWVDAVTMRQAEISGGEERV